MGRLAKLPVDGKLRCSKCTKLKHVDKFYKCNRTVAGYKSACIECWLKDDRERYYRDPIHRGVLRYGITGEQYREMLKGQGGKCFVCKDKPGKKNLYVDQ